MVDNSSKGRRDVDYVRHISFELHHEEFHHKANIVSNMEPVPQSEENKSGQLREILVACEKSNNIIIMNLHQKSGDRIPNLCSKMFDAFEVSLK